MFYSETLLSKTGPLARVWLSANIERKLSKQHVLQSDIGTSVNAIVDQGQAPMALRLSGQLLLGVVRIYSRKARYLLDDCNEALMKLKMTFRSSNNDHQINQVNDATRDGLTLADGITDPSDMIMSHAPDDSILFTQKSGNTLHELSHKRAPREETISLIDPSQPFPGTISGRDLDDVEEDIGLFPDDLPLDIGEDETSIERGRDAPAARPDDLLSDDGKLLFDEELNLHFDDENIAPIVDDAFHEDIEMGGQDDAFNFPLEDQTADMFPANLTLRTPREDGSQSPLSTARPSVERTLDQMFQPNSDSGIDLVDEVEEAREHQRAKKRRVIELDDETRMRAWQVQEQQDDRSKILKPVSLLPRDPTMLTLMAMQRNGAFVSNVLGDGQAKGWAPELQGLLSFEVVKRSGELKRKRDSGVADVGEEESASPIAGKQPRLDLGEDEGMPPMDDDFGGFGGDTTLGGDQEILDLPPAEEARQNDDDNEVYSPIVENFDETAAPLVHPAEDGPISLGTQHAVHLLRDRFGAESAESSTQQKKAHVVFQDLLPEATTSKADATKMFFEVLVLATKDAVKVEQSEGILGGPIRVRGKRGLWGAWAERQAGGEIAEQTVSEPTQSGVLIHSEA